MCSYKTRTGVSRFTGTQFICMRLSKFTSKLLYTVHSLPRINKKNICTFLCIYSLLPIFHINRPEEEGEKHTHTDTQIKWLNTVQSFKVFGSKLFCSCQKKKKKKAKCFHSSNQTALTSYLNSSDRLPVMLCANTKGEKIYIYIKKSWIEFWVFFCLIHSLFTGSYAVTEVTLLLHMLATLNFYSFPYAWKCVLMLNHFPAIRRTYTLKTVIPTLYAFSLQTAVLAQQVTKAAPWFVIRHCM